MAKPEEAEAIKNENLSEALTLLEEFYEHMPYMDDTSEDEVETLRNFADRIHNVVAKTIEDLKDFDPARLRKNIKMWEEEEKKMQKQLQDDQRGV